MDEAFVPDAYAANPGLDPPWDPGPWYRLPVVLALGIGLGPVALGMARGAVDGFLRVAIGPAYRSVLDARLPGAYAQAVADADAHFAGQAPAAGAWRLTREEAQRIDQPVLAVLGGESAEDWAGWPEVQARLQEWLPQAEPVVLPGANHALPWQDPHGVAEALAAFFARHPLRARA